ncbi:MAG: ribonuclease HI family protein [Candidatus Aenigmarchaeota archaeon]|nr:ribonuclease HI family protein [Candidatus Aenigmarchaeota archaeon]
MFELYTDGGARGNPGPAAIGGILYQRVNDQQKIIKQFSKFIGHATNNQAEYQSLIFGLQLAKQLNVQEINCYLDSELVVKQINHQYKIKNKELLTLFIQIWNLLPAFKKIHFFHIPRNQNQQADKLVNQALDKEADSQYKK